MPDETYRAEPQRSRLKQGVAVYTGRMRAKDVCPARIPATKILWSGLGSLLGILAIQMVALAFPATDAVFLIGSFGASAVLIYGAPLAEFSQPRNLVGGHVVSAIVGVTVALGSALLPAAAGAVVWAPAVAVAIAVVAMHCTRTLHPPGGATALIAVIGSPHIHALGWRYILFPVALGSLAMLVIALFVNNVSNNPKRHYPVYWW